jgi:quercetin dioxygenase-like cupin family protein
MPTARAPGSAAIRRAAAPLLASVALAALLPACQEAERPAAPTAPTRPRLTMGQGSTPTFIGQATYHDVDKVKRKTKDWSVELKAKGGLEVVVRSFAYAPGSFTGWHRHPGPVLIQVVEGTVAFFEADDPCTPIVVRAGEGYLDTGEHGHIGRNLSGAPARDITIYLAPPGTQVSALRIDMPEPHGAGGCS